MTLYLLHGFSKALEFGVDVPREMVKPAWDYMHRHYLDDIVREMMAHDSGWEFVTFINYVLSIIQMRHGTRIPSRPQSVRPCSISVSNTGSLTAPI